MNKILVVDDCAQNRELLGYMLSEAGYDFLCAEDGQKACDLVLLDADIDMILMDVSMPVMDGVTATARIKTSIDDTRFLPIIFVTFMDDNDLLARCLGVGGDDFIPKPVNETVLLAKIQAHKRTQTLNRSLQMANQQLALHQQAMECEHAIVERIFTRSVKRGSSLCKNIRKYTSPMSMFNGDVVLEAPAPSGGAYLLVGDFTGHGLAAAVGILPVSEIFFRLAMQESDVGQFAREMNHSLRELLPENMFFCAAIVYLEPGGEKLSLWMGGMNDALYVSDADSKVSSISSQHMSLGILADEEFESDLTEIALDSDARIYIYSDGVCEARNTNDEEFGVAEIRRIVSGEYEDRLMCLVNAVKNFQSGTQTDDVSVVELSAGPVVHTPIMG